MMSGLNLPDTSLSLLEAIAYNETHNARQPLFRYDDADGQVRSITWNEAGKAFDIAANIVQSYVSIESVLEADMVVGIVANLGASTCLI